MLGRVLGAEHAVTSEPYHLSKGLTMQLPCVQACGTCAGALDEVDWLRNKLERLETSISAMARSAAAGPAESGTTGIAQPLSGRSQDYKYDK